MIKKLTPLERLRIRARSGVADETLTAYMADRERVRSVSASRIEDAARAEGIALPRAAQSSSPPGAA